MSAVRRQHGVCIALLFASSVALKLSARAPTRASPHALRALRDLALVGEQLRELRAAVLPAAEQSMLPSIDELSALSLSLESGTDQLSASVGALCLSMQATAREASVETVPAATRSPGTEPTMRGKPASLKDMRLQASRLHQLVDEERQVAATEAHRT